MRSRRGIGELVLVVALVCAAAGCGGGSSSSTTSTTLPAQTSPAQTTTTCKTGQSSTAANPCTGGVPSVASLVTNAWTTFFNGATPVAQRIALLAGGTRFSSTIKSLSQNPLASKTSATVSKVVVTGPTTATVTFSVFLGGLPVLKDVKGTAVLQNGSWLVDAGSLCKLLQLENSKLSACVGTSASH